MSPEIPMNGRASYAKWKSINQVRLLDYVVVLLCMVFIPSAVAQSLLGWDEKTTFVLLAPTLLFAALIAHRFKIHKTIPLLSLSIILTGATASMISKSTSQLLMGVTLAVAVIVARQMLLTLEKPKVLRAVSWFTLAMLLGGVVGIAYSLIGGQPLLDLKVGYRTTYLYLTTFSFAFIGNTIRPSGIFDEPGSFAMYVTIVTMFNDTLRQNPKLNVALVILLIFTGALAGLAMSVLYLISSNAMKLQRKRSLALVSTLLVGFMLLSVLAPRNLVTTTVETFYSDRFLVEDGRLAGDNRSNQVVNFFEIMDGEMLLRGVKNSIKRYDTHDMSSNPFSITYGYGLLISLPYFALLLWLVGVTIQQGFHNSYTSLGLLFLLLQRPFLYHMSWSIMIAATVWLLHRSAQVNRPRRIVAR